MSNERARVPQVEKRVPVDADARALESKAAPRSAAYLTPQTLNALGPASPDDIPLTRGNILFLHRTIGNRAVGRLLQKKVKLSQPGDAYEREADRVAEQVLSMDSPAPVQGKAPAPQISRVPLGGGECPKCGKELRRRSSDKNESREQAEEETAVQMKCKQGEPCEHCEQERQVQPKEVAGRTPAGAPGVESRIESLRAGGEPLPPATQQYFGERFGHDFSQVRVHTDAWAAASARAIHARAYTTGRDVVFGSGEYSPDTTEGRKLLAHELTHVVQQSAAAPLAGRASEPAQQITPSNTFTVQRDELPDAGVGDAGTPTSASNAPASGARYGVSLSGNEGISFAGVFFPPDITLLRQAVGELMAAKGTESAEKVLDNLEDSASSIKAERSDRSGVDAETELLDKLTGRLTAIVPNLREVRAAVKRDRKKFVEDFEKQAKANVQQTLKTSEETAEREAVRYGLTREKVLAGVSRAGPFYKTKHHMQTGTPVAVGLQKTAGVLLGRRQKIAELKKEQLAATRTERDPYDPKGGILVPDEPKYSQLGAEIEKEKASYKQLRSAAASEYPVLAAVSELDKGTGDLETIAKKGAGDETAQVIAEQIAERLTSIEKVRANLDDKGSVNIWRLPPVVEVTSVQLGAHTDPLKKLWVSEQVEEEKPGVLGAVALFLFNLLALALAPATGGISLAVAAGVNVVATGLEVQDYLMQKALATTDLDKAKSLSQDEPSLLWLALAIVGTLADVGGAVAALRGTFRALAPLAKTALAAKEGKQAQAAAKALAKAAEDAGGPALAKRVLTNVSRTRGGESLVWEAAGVTSKTELEALEAAAKVTKSELSDLIGQPVRGSAGQVKISKAGHIFSCVNPCPTLREKYAALLANKPEFEAEVASLERRAAALAGEAQTGVNQQVDAMARHLKQDTAVLEVKMQQFSGPKPIDIAAQEAIGGHTIERHGAQLTLDEMRQRALGLHPTLPQSRTALKFKDVETHVDAVEKAYLHYQTEIQQHFASAGAGPKAWTFDYGAPLGEGYTNIGTLSHPVVQVVDPNQVTKVTIAFKPKSGPPGYYLRSAYPAWP